MSELTNNPLTTTTDLTIEQVQTELSRIIDEHLSLQTQLTMALNQALHLMKRRDKFEIRHAADLLDTTKDARQRIINYKINVVDNIKDANIMYDKLRYLADMQHEINSDDECL